jgi:EpsD family peptidyl-prolyl cis-trans isomerase
MALALAGCEDRQPEGQTAAVVNGEPITETAVDMEVAASQNRITREQALKGLIDRALIVDQAKKQKLDQRPQFTLELRRMSDLLLSKQFVEGMTRASGDSITALNVNSYLAQHPEIGSNRRRITLKQAVFSEPATPKLRADLEATKSYAALIEVLQAHQVKFEEGSTTVDSALASEPLLKAIASAEPGEPFIIVADGRALANVVDKEVPLGMSNEQELELARARMQQESMAKKLEQLMQTWRKGADIKYSEKYTPGAKKEGKAGAGT